MEVKFTYSVGGSFGSDASWEHSTTLWKVKLLPSSDVSFLILDQLLFFYNFLLIFFFCSFQFFSGVENFHRSSRFNSTVPFCICYIMCCLKFSIWINISITSIGYTIRSTIFVMELSMWTNFISKFVGIIIEILFQILSLVSIFYCYYYFFGMIFI